MKVLSLFDGMSCGRIALERAGLPVTTYFASELDKHAIAVAQKNYPSTVQLGDVRVVREMAEAGFFGKIDLLIGGSPCQGFSFAGHQLAFDDPRSVLFFEFVRILRALQRDNPNINFMLENVKMKKEHLDVITNFLGVNPVFINSALVSAQNRQRYYWANWKIEQPADRGILLKDIIENGEVDRDKSYCIDANYFKGGSLNNYLEKSRRQIVISQSEARLMVKVPDKAYCLTANYSKLGAPSLSNVERYFDKGIGQLIVKEATKKGFVEIHPNEGVDLTFLTAAKCDFNWFDGAVIRKLTPVECERLQTVPDNYTAGVSDLQRYKMLGNGWTVEVVAHIFRGLRA